MRDLTKKQKRFVDEYLIDLNATQAAIRAGYSEKTAYSTGQRLTKNAEIQSYIQERQESRQKRTEITQDKVLQELAKIAFADIDSQGEASRLKVSDKLIALDRLAKHLGMYIDKEALELKKQELEIKRW